MPRSPSYSRGSEEAKQGSRGFLWATAQQGDKPSLDLQVTGTTLDRALRIMDALIKGITARGYSLTISPGPPARTAAEVLGEVIEFRLEEKISQVEHVLTPAERADKLKYGWSSVPAHDDAPTGALTLRLRAEPYSRTYAGIRQSWRDGKRQRVEDCLNDFVVALVLAAEAKKVERARIEALHQRWAVEARERAERERLRLEEEARIKALEHQSAVWSKVAEIRSYLAAVRAAVERQGEIIEAGSALDEWLRWAEAHVDQCDPVRALLARTSLVNTTEAPMVRPAPLSTGDEQA